MITDVFLNQKRVNVCEHMVKIAPFVVSDMWPDLNCVFIIYIYSLLTVNESVIIVTL